MPGVISTNIKRVLTDGRGKINKYGENPPRTDTFFLTSETTNLITPNAGDVIVENLFIVPPEVFSQNTASTGKLTDIYIVFKTTDATKVYLKTMNIKKASFGSTSVSFTAGGTGDTTVESYSADADTDWYAATTYGNTDHDITSSSNIMLIHRPVLSTATQLTVKPLDIINVILTWNRGAAAASTLSQTIALEFTRGSI